MSKHHLKLTNDTFLKSSDLFQLVHHRKIKSYYWKKWNLIFSIKCSKKYCLSHHLLRFIERLRVSFNRSDIWRKNSKLWQLTDSETDTERGPETDSEICYETDTERGSITDSGAFSLQLYTNLINCFQLQVNNHSMIDVSWCHLSELA